jgi:hypothetical protein
MDPLPQTKAGNLLPIFEAMVKEGNLQDRSSGQHCLARLLLGYQQGGMDAYVDDSDHPKHVIVFGKFPGIVTAEKLGVVLFAYSVPEERGSAASMGAFREQIDAYAAVAQVDAVLASDWRFGGCNLGTGHFLKSIGFEIQENTFVKIFKKPQFLVPDALKP